MDNAVNKSELYFLILHFLSGSQCQESVKVLERELRGNGLLPQKFDWLGESRTASYDDLRTDNPNISNDHLEKLLSRLLELSRTLNPTPTPSNSLLATRAYSLLPEKQPEIQVPEYKPDPKKGNLFSILGEDTDIDPTQFESGSSAAAILSSALIDIETISNNNNAANDAPTNSEKDSKEKDATTPALPPHLEKVKLKYSREKTFGIVTKNVMSRISSPGSNLVGRLVSKELRGTSHLQKTPPICVYNRFQKLTSILGHKDALYCLKFDITGTRVFSGADDFLVKVWSVETGRLLATLRGHEGEITDMAVNFNNTLLATSSTDNTIRVWNLNTYAQEAVLIGHSRLEPNVITTICFCPASKVLISGDNNGECKIWNVDEFHKPNQQALTVSCAPSTIKCLSISKGGSFFATVGDTVVRIWSISSSPQLIAQLRSHRESVYYVQYSHFTDQIVTGSDDGTCRIWTPQGNKTWRHVVLSPKSGTAPARKIGSIRMVIWSCDDRLVIAAAANTIMVWDSVTGSLQHLLTEHKREVYVLDGHPNDPRIALSAGYDGEVIVWDLIKGIALHKFEIDTAYIGCELTDGCFSRSGAHFAVCGVSGKLHVFGTGSIWGYRNTPAEQFFATDYAPVLRDQNGWVVDEATQLPPHRVKSLVVNFASEPYIPQPPAVPEPFQIDPDEVVYSRERQREMLRLEVANAERKLRTVTASEEPEEAALLPAKPPPRRRSRPWREALPSPPLPPDSSESDSSSDSEFSGSEDDDDEDDLENNENGGDAMDEDYQEPTAHRVKTRSIKKKISPIKTKSGRTVRRVPRGDDSEEYSESEEDEPDGTPPQLDSDEDDSAISRTPTKKRKGPKPTWTTVVERNSLHVPSYVPQLGDLVVYFYQGHERYKEKFPDNLRDPKTIITGLPPMQECKVKSIFYKMHAAHRYVYACITLAPNIANSTVTFQVNYHASDEPDYLVLASKFEHAVRNSHLWQPGQRFRMYYADKSSYYYGRITKIEQELPGSHWDSLNVAWDNGDVDTISPWEMEPIEEPLKNTTTITTSNGYTNSNNNNINNNNYDPMIIDPNTNSTTAVSTDADTYTNTTTTTTTTATTTPTPTNDNIETALPNPITADTPTNTSTLDTLNTTGSDLNESKTDENEQVDIDDEVAKPLPLSKWVVAHEFEESKHLFEEMIPEEERSRILQILMEIVESEIAEVFRVPVNLRHHQFYLLVNPHPMDLGTIINRVQNNYYRRVDALVLDLALIHRNAFKYNDTNSDIVRDSRILHRQIGCRLFNKPTPIDMEAPLVDLENPNEDGSGEVPSVGDNEAEGKGKGRAKVKSNTKGKGKAKVENDNNNNNNNWGEGSSGASKEKEDNDNGDEEKRNEDTAPKYALRSRASTANENVTFLKQNKPTPKIVVKLKGLSSTISGGLSTSPNSNGPYDAGTDESASSGKRKRKKPEKYSDDEYATRRDVDSNGYSSDDYYDSDDNRGNRRSSGRREDSQQAFHITRSRSASSTKPNFGEVKEENEDSSRRRSSREVKKPQYYDEEFQDEPLTPKRKPTSPNLEDDSELRRSSRAKKPKVDLYADAPAAPIHTPTRKSERARTAPARLGVENSHAGSGDEYEEEYVEHEQPPVRATRNPVRAIERVEEPQQEQPPVAEQTNGRVTRSRGATNGSSKRGAKKVKDYDDDDGDYEEDFEDEEDEDEEVEEESEEEYTTKRSKSNGKSPAKGKTNKRATRSNGRSKRKKDSEDDEDDDWDDGEDEDEFEEDEGEDDEEDHKPSSRAGRRGRENSNSNFNSRSYESEKAPPSEGRVLRSSRR